MPGRSRNHFSLLSKRGHDWRSTVSMRATLRPTDLWGRSQIKRGQKSGIDWSELGWRVHKSSPLIHRQSEKQSFPCDRDPSHRCRKVVSPKTEPNWFQPKKENWPNCSPFHTRPAKSNKRLQTSSHSYFSFLNWVRRLSPDMSSQTVWPDTQHDSDV